MNNPEMENQKFEARDILRKAFPGIPKREADELVSFGSMESYDPGIVLCKEGAIEYTLFIMIEGRVKVTKVINDAENRQLKILEPGDFWGKWA